MLTLLAQGSSRNARRPRPAEEVPVIMHWFVDNAADILRWYVDMFDLKSASRQDYYNY